MKKKLITIFANNTEVSLETQAILTKKLIDKGYTVMGEYSADSELIICIGGDGSFLETVHSCDFPSCPIIGINTGHLGFFQEISPENLNLFIDDYEKGEYSIQHLNTVVATITTVDGRQNRHLGLNEIVIKGRQSYSVHFYISIDSKPIEKFSGDGILVATSAGSTAYNYSLGGSVVDPRLKLLQVTPIAPMNTTAYRSFTSSILLPSELSLGVTPEQRENKIFIINDGIETGYSNVKDIKVETSETAVHLLRFKNYDFWNKVKTKFL
ncbi:MAG: NAD(+)/NADH kinase [Clostridiales bacterium]|nr:NAD(+)/NADH kinase [Clostridiales bacterium]